MNKSETSQQDLCLLCGEFISDFKKTILDTTDFSKNTISQTLGELIKLILSRKNMFY